MASKPEKTPLAVWAAIAGFAVGAILSDPRTIAESYAVPMPYRVPKFPGAVTLRLAMAHDVIHERFPRHGLAFYRERERIIREKLKAIPPDSDEAFALADDIGVGLEREGKSDEAARVIQEKLSLQEKRGLSGRALYTSYANLGTFQAHANLKKAIAGDAEAKKCFKEGLDFVRKSIEANPEAHFGRETWQVALGEFILAAIERPEILKEFDFVGNRLDATINMAKAQAIDKQMYSWRSYQRAMWIFVDNDDPEINPEGRAYIRDNYITKVGAEEGWSEIPVISHKMPAAFDEPVLGIIGMWRQGGGASPHFALCLGEIMMRVGQRYIAWCAFERASRMADKFWPNPEMQQFLREHCAKRQKELEAKLSRGEVKGLRPRFEDELAYGESFQKEYQEYEAKQIAAGASIHDEHFFDEFLKGREPIATPPGPEEWHVGYVVGMMDPIINGAAWGLFVAGVAAICVALIARLVRCRSKTPAG